MDSNTLFASIFVDALIQSGLEHVVLAPGSRHTPLVLAFAAREELTIHSHLDERCAAFYALGLALGTEKPTAVCCTSGTAGANMYPAIIEAHQSQIPLIIITADRPPELHHSGANQTIDQIHLFGNYAKWFVEMGLPEEHPNDTTIRNLRSTAHRAFAIANGHTKGVVHINIPFRKPLEPAHLDDVTKAAAEAKRSNSTLQWYTASHPKTFPLKDVESIAQVINATKQGIIVLGTNIRPEAVNHQILKRFAQITGYPIIADPLSNQRWHPELSEYIIGGYDTFLNAKHLHPAEIVIRVGNVPTSKALNDYIATSPQTLLQISENGSWSDDLHLTTHFIEANPEAFFTILADCLPQRPNESSHLSKWQSSESLTWSYIATELEQSTYFDGGVVYDVIDLLPDRSTLFIGNSLPIRHVDQFGKPSTKSVTVYGNRGASGIDGNISTALGLGKALPHQPLVAILGDITFYHDMNGLLAIQRCNVPITIVLLNNNGGGIFHRLPIRKFEPPFTDLFVTPHQLDYEHVARLYGLEFARINVRDVSSRNTFRQVFSQATSNTKHSTLIEVRSDARHDFVRREEIIKAITNALNENS